MSQCHSLSFNAKNSSALVVCPKKKIITESFPCRLHSTGISGPGLEMPRQPSEFSEKLNRSQPLSRKAGE